MNYKTKNKIIATICQGKSLFIKNTGIKVIVDYLGTDINNNRRGRSISYQFCNVELLDPPTTKSLSLFENFHIKRNSHSNKMELNGVINISNLSLSPYESKAGKLLYGKTKKGN